MEKTIKKEALQEIISNNHDPANHGLCWTIDGQLMEWSDTSYSESAGGRFPSYDLRYIWDESKQDYIRL
tara:strand:+ start:224 stop:430 length:207 start_codon:yes stop_codon:yes gene_type:complete